jgi:hypothetical protein
MVAEHCGITPDYTNVAIVERSPEPELADYRAAMALAEEIAHEKLGEYMLLSWYDRDRDFESPQHSSECHQDSAVPGYVDYGLNHGATLKIDLYQGRFIFFLMGL